MITNLNKNHERRLLNTFQYIDSLLSDFWYILSVTPSPSLFQEYIDDVPDNNRIVIQDHIEHLREAMYCILVEKGIQVSEPSISIIKAIQTRIHFVHIAIEELKPRYMRGYGELSSAAVDELEQIASTLQAQLRNFDDCVKKISNGS